MHNSSIGHYLPIAPNLLNRDCAARAPDQGWTGDITYIPTDEGWQSLAVVVDLFRRKVVGWSMREDFHQLLDRYCIRPSMSRMGYCWENAVTETLFWIAEGGTVARGAFPHHPGSRRRSACVAALMHGWCVYSTRYYISPVQ